MNADARELGQRPTSVITDPTRADLPNRSRTMHLLYEDLARAQIAERLDEAARQRQINRIRSARRLARRAERASRRARRALALASMQ